MVPAHPEIKTEIAHGKVYGWKINQSFVYAKKVCLMAGWMYKWLLFPICLIAMEFSAKIPVDYPIPYPAFRGTSPLYPIPHFAGQVPYTPVTTYHLPHTTYHPLSPIPHPLLTTHHPLPTIPYPPSPIPYSNHPYFVSVSELEWNRQEKQMELSCKIYTDDFEEALKTAGGEKADLVKGDAARNKARMEAYIRAHFRVKVNGKPLTLQFIGTENDHEATWCYLQSPVPEAPASMEIVNTLLYEIKKEQVNIVHLKSGDARKSFRLVNPDQVIQWKVD
jgi:hypothetical protein